MSHSRGIPMLVNPALRPGLDALSWWLEDHHYSQHARETILHHAALEGTLAGSPYVDPGDEPGAEAAFVEALPAVPQASAAWDRPDVFLDARMLAAGTHPLPFGEPDGDADRSIPPGAVLVPPELEPDAPDADPAIRFPGVAPLIERMGIAPIAGGAPDETYEPTPTEWSEACALFRDGDRDQLEQMRRWYAAHPIAEFNAVRTD